MTTNTKIEWADHTFNPWTGCTKVSVTNAGGPGGCDLCYAEAWSKRAGAKVGKWGPGAPRVRTTPANWKLPLKWDANAAAFQAEHGRRQRVFCASLADVFDNEVDPQWRVDLFDLIAATPNLDWLLLTKRIGNAFDMMKVATERQRTADPGRDVVFNVWLGATVVNQEEADRDIPKLLAVPAAKRFLSMEPLLETVNLRSDWLIPKYTSCQMGGKTREAMQDMVKAAARRMGETLIDWVIAGGESGPGARPMHPDWARSLRDQCQAAGVPFLFKQWGEWLGQHQDGAHDHDPIELNATDGPVRVGKKAAGRLLDGREWNGVPA